MAIRLLWKDANGDSREVVREGPRKYLLGFDWG